MAYEMQTDEMQKRGQQIADYLTSSFGDRVGYMVMLFNEEAIACNMAGSNEKILERQMRVMVTLFENIIREHGKDDASRIIFEMLSRVINNVSAERLLSEIFKTKGV